MMNHYCQHTPSIFRWLLELPKSLMRYVHHCLSSRLYRHKPDQPVTLFPVNSSSYTFSVDCDTCQYCAHSDTPAWCARAYHIPITSGVAHLSARNWQTPHCHPLLQSPSDVTQHDSNSKIDVSRHRIVAIAFYLGRILSYSHGALCPLRPR